MKPVRRLVSGQDGRKCWPTNELDIGRIARTFAGRCVPKSQLLDTDRPAGPHFSRARYPPAPLATIPAQHLGPDLRPSAGRQLGRKKCLPALLWLRARTKRAPMKLACRAAILRAGSCGPQLGRRRRSRCPARSASGWMTPSCAGTLASPRILAIAKRCRPPPPRRGSPSRAMWK